jgi:hypothetical protein
MLSICLALVLLGPTISTQGVPQPDDFKPDPSWKAQGKSLWFDPKERKLILRARVAIQDGFLEHLLCLSQTKEHESVLATDAEPRLIHAGLLLTGAEPGHPVRFRPKFEPPAGTPIVIRIEWKGTDGKIQTANARDWIKEEKSGKHLMHDFVFAGSELFKNEQTGRVMYAAESGDLFTVANFTNAILDLPFASSADDTSRSYKADETRVPPRGTWVSLILTPLKKTPATPKS